MKFKYEFEAVQAVYHERPRSVPYHGHLEVVRIFFEILLSTTKNYPNDKLKSAGRMQKRCWKRFASWLELLQLIADCKLVTETHLDHRFSWLKLQPAINNSCNELPISYQLQQLQSGNNCNCLNELFRKWKPVQNNSKKQITVCTLEDLLKTGPFQGFRIIRRG